MSCNYHESAQSASTETIQWIWQALNDKSALGFWRGEAAGATYYINPPRAAAGDVDATPFESLWGIVPYFDNDDDDYYFPVPSPEQGKAVCERHSLTRDKSEMLALLDAAITQWGWFYRYRDAALAELTKPFYQHRTPWLSWIPTDDNAREFYNKTAYRTYMLHYESEHRWCVTITRNGETTEAPRFLTREIAKMACAFHAHT